MNGKGDTPRPIPDWDQYAKNWDAVFGKKPERSVQFCRTHCGKKCQCWATAQACGKPAGCAPGGANPSDREGKQ